MSVTCAAAAIAATGSKYVCGLGSTAASGAMSGVQIDCGVPAHQMIGPPDDVEAALLVALRRVQQGVDGWTGRCPAHPRSSLVMCRHSEAMTKVACIGAGSWGTTVAALIAQNGHEVVLWCRRSELGGRDQQRRLQREVPAGHPPAGEPEGDGRSSRRRMAGAEVCVMGVPSHGWREILGTISSQLRTTSRRSSASRRGSRSTRTSG